MLNYLLKFSFAIALLGSVTFISCESESTDTPLDVENFVSGSVQYFETRAGCGRSGCFEFVFPISIQFADGTTAEADSYESLRTVIRDWRTANPDSDERPDFVYPIEVIAEDGSIVTIASQEELADMASTCPRRRRGNRGGHCFSVVFPITINFPDGTAAAANDRKELKELVRQWKADNPDATERPSLAFPIDVELEDETIQTIASQEELVTLKESCASN